MHFPPLNFMTDLGELYSLLLVLLILPFTAVETEAHMSRARVLEVRLSVNDRVRISTPGLTPRLGPPGHTASVPA